MPSSSSARMTRTAISPRLATRTFANMRREGYSVAERAAAQLARALDGDGVEACRAPPAHPPAGDRLGVVGDAARPAPAAQHAGELGVVGRRAARGGRDVRECSRAERVVLRHGRRGTPRASEASALRRTAEKFAQGLRSRGVVAFRAPLPLLHSGRL